jgi:hypothetical protein
MNDLEHKLKVLAEIGRVLDEKEITWAIGASLLLYLKGMVSSFHDIDLLVAEKDLKKLKEALSPFGKSEPSKLNNRYKTKEFLEYCLEGVEIDVIAGFGIVSGGKDYYFPLTKEGIKERILVNGVSIPLMSVQDWRVYYALMGRAEKVSLIDSAMAEKTKGKIS